MSSSYTSWFHLHLKPECSRFFWGFSLNSALWKKGYKTLKSMDIFRQTVMELSSIYKHTPPPSSVSVRLSPGAALQSIDIRCNQSMLLVHSLCCCQTRWKEKQTIRYTLADDLTVLSGLIFFLKEWKSRRFLFFSCRQKVGSDSMHMQDCYVMIKNIFFC